MGSSSSMHKTAPRHSGKRMSDESKERKKSNQSQNISKSRDVIQDQSKESKVTEEKSSKNDIEDSSLQTESMEDVKKMYQESPHLEKEFKEIDNFRKEIREDELLRESIYKSSYRLGHLGFENETDSDRKKIGDYMAITDMADVIHKSYEALLTSVGVNCMGSLTVDIVKANEQSVLKMSILRTIVWNNTDASLALGEKVCKTGMLKHFVEDLKVMKVQDIVNAYGDLDNVFESAISVLQNCSRNPVTRQTLREYDTVKYLLPFIKCTSEEGKLQTLFTLANLVDESENEVLLADETLFNILLDILREALDDDEHRHLGFSVEELVDGMTGLAKNETNKKVLTEKGAVSILIDILKAGSDEEKEHAVKCVWELAFDKDNKQAFMANEELMNLLNTLKSSPKKKVRKAAEGALWVIHLEDKDKALSPHHDLIGGSAAPFKGHVMISYQWADQKILLKIRDSLRQNGFNVWMDVDDMGGSTLDAMAEAVQNSAVVLVCMSEKYKMSQNCRSEAEYAFSLEKTIVPLLMQRGYKPDGWLGMIKGTKLFFDFSGKYPYEQKVGDLMRELGQKGKQHRVITDEPDGDVPIVPVVHVPVEAAKGQSVSNWSQKDVQNWLTKIGLQKNSTLQSLSGDNLVFLKDVAHRAPEFFFNYLRTDLQLQTLNDLMNFTRAIDKL